MDQQKKNPFEALPSPEWAPFTVCETRTKPPYLRGLSTPEGLGDRFRFVAFAEKQAAVSFGLAPIAFPHVSEGVKKIWLTLAREEEKHMQWLLWRMEELNVSLGERPVSSALWDSFSHCKNEQEFAKFMASSEEHGRLAGEKFYQTLLSIDPVSANIFDQIAKEEQQHIRLARAVMDLNFQVPADFDVTLEVMPLDTFRK